MTKLALVIGAALGIAFLCAATILAVSTVRALAAEVGHADESRQLLDELTAVEAGVVAAEASVRGYLLTGRTAYLDDYGEERTTAITSTAPLRRLTEGRAELQVSLTEVAARVDAAFAFLQRVLTAHTSEGAVQAGALMTAGPDHDAGRRARAAVGAMRDAVSDTWAQRASAARVRSARVEVWLIVLGIGNIALVVVRLGLIRRHLLFRIGSERALRRDISERKEVERLKDEFVAMVSHELRTPLTSVRGALQLVLTKPGSHLAGDESRMLGIALNNCERLIRTVNDILDASKIAAGKMDLRLGACPVDDVVRESIESVSETARAMGVTIVADVDRGLPPLKADCDRVVQILVNLLSNAVKFSPRDGVVRLDARRDGATVAMCVTDQGAGIPDHDLDKLFTRFQQLDGSATRRAGGTGLGLAIVKGLVDQHGGTVRVHSREGDGSTFTVAIPVDPASD